MAVQKKRVGLTRRRRKLAGQHGNIDLPKLISCSKCGAFKKSHHVCGECGYYRGRQIMFAK